MKLLYDVQNNKWYNENGESFSSENPAIPYGNSERVVIQLYSEVKGTNSGSEAVAEWTKYTGFTGSGYGAILATDNNFLHWYKAKLATALSSGTIATGTQIDVTTNESVNNISETGNIYLYDADGDNEAIAYSSRETISGGIRFIAAAGNVLENSYAVNDQTDIPEMLYAEAVMVAAASDPATGLFAFDFVCDSTKLRNKMQYSSIEKVDDCKGLELTVFQTQQNNIISIRKRFRCTTFRIVGGIADLKTGVSIPTPEENTIIALLNSFISQGMDLQCSVNGTTWVNYADVTDFQAQRWFRIRLHSSSGSWSDAIPLIVGATGQAGQSVYPYIAYASDTSGTDFTMTWSETATSNLKYIAYLMSTVQIATPTAAHFAGLWVRFGGLDLRPYWDEGGSEDPIAVDWSDITNKPSTFPPATHQHDTADLKDKARQLISSGSTINTLYIDKDIIEKNTVHSSGTLTIDFPYIKKSDGTTYTPQAGDVFTWELWITASAKINSFLIGGSSTIEQLSGFPETLNLIDSANTRHVFTVRGIYKSGAVNNLKILVNYAYSERAN